MSILPAPEPTIALGASGLRVSAMGWGMWRYRGEDVSAARALVEAALETGLTLLDTADIYGPGNGEPFGAAETLLGRVLKEAPHLRARFTLATKGGIVPGRPYDSSDLVASCEASLKRLGLDHVELYQIHRPDLLTHPAEAARALDALRQAGKITTAGVSNFTAAQTAALQAHAPFPLASIQPEFSPIAIGALQDGVLDQALERNLAVLAWSPLGGGRLMNPTTPQAQAVAAALDVIATENGVGRSAAAYAWVLAHPARPIPLVGSQQIERIREAADALRVRMTRAQWYAVLVAARGAPLP